MKPWLWIPAGWAHALSPYALRAIGLFSSAKPPTWRPFVWRNIVFRNPLGLAGGADKDADNLPAWAALGCGFVEIGTVTLRPQSPNPGKIINRHPPTRSLWNRMGFPSAGSEEVLANLRAEKPYPTPVFVNIGKNRETPNESAVNDYLELIKIFSEVADAFVVNISSPNTKGLRDLQNKEALRALLIPLKKASESADKPLMVKLSPDMDDDSLVESLEAAMEADVDGFVLTNTTLSRTEGVPYPPEGGMSGAPLKAASLKALRTTLDTLGPRREGKLIVSVGGVMTPADVFERLQMGADLVEVYSVLVLDGPGFFQKVAKEA